MGQTPLVNQQQLEPAQATARALSLRATSPHLKSLFQQLISQ